MKKRTIKKWAITLAILHIINAGLYFTCEHTKQSNDELVAVMKQEAAIYDAQFAKVKEQKKEGESK